MSDLTSTCPFVNEILSRYNNNICCLKLAVNKNDSELYDLYLNTVLAHNEAVLQDSHPNSGFDLFVPNETVVSTTILSTMIPLGVKCEMLGANGVPSPFYMYTRSSISKTPLILSNHVGIIDSGYRGVLQGAFRSLTILQNTTYTVEKHTRLLQICGPTLGPFYVVLVDESDLSVTTRDEGGFGSTGR